ncbi:MAG: SpoIIE family protein phosphatase [Mangrovicoccus sp.]
MDLFVDHGLMECGGGWGHISWAAARKAKYAGGECGDGYVLVNWGGNVLVFLADGAGSGKEAAAPMGACLRCAADLADRELPTIFENCHRELIGTRGAALAALCLDPERSLLTWAAIGDVDGIVAAAESAEDVVKYSIVRRGGTLGISYANPVVQKIHISRNDTIILASDGVSRKFSRIVRPNLNAEDLARSIISKYGNQKDDSSTVVIKIGANR